MAREKGVLLGRRKVGKITERLNDSPYIIKEEWERTNDPLPLMKRSVVGHVLGTGLHDVVLFEDELSSWAVEFDAPTKMHHGGSIDISFEPGMPVKKISIRLTDDRSLIYCPQRCTFFKTQNYKEPEEVLSFDEFKERGDELYSYYWMMVIDISTHASECGLYLSDHYNLHWEEGEAIAEAYIKDYLRQEDNYVDVTKYISKQDVAEYYETYKEEG